MARIAEPYVVQKRNDTETFIVTLNVASGLPRPVYKAWNRRSFTKLPDALAMYRSPSSKAAAKRGARALIEYLKKEAAQKKFDPSADSFLVGEWLEKFTAFEGNPRSARITGKNRPYSPATVKGYRSNFNLYLRRAPLMRKRIGDLEQTDMLELMSRIGEIKVGASRKKDPQKKNAGYKMAGTRTFEIVIKFVRMAFREYGMTHPRWLNPFQGIETPTTEENPRDILDNEETLKLFSPDAGAFKDAMEKAVCAAMYWAGLRRAEIFALRPGNLDWNWKNPVIHVESAWKNFGSSDREIGDPKWHKKRGVPFPAQLQAAIKELWDEQGTHEFVFAWRKGFKKGHCLSMAECDIPGPKWGNGRMKKWIARAGINVSGRRIVPHSARHSLATILELENVPLRHIQDLLGHSDYKTTKGYLHTIEGTLAKITASAAMYR
jgi:site-specific recombinase XerC